MDLLAANMISLKRDICISYPKVLRVVMSLLMIYCIMQKCL